MGSVTRYVGLDVHKNSVSVAVAEPDRSPARDLGSIPNDLPRLLRLLEQLGTPETLEICYEAGPTGFALQRELCNREYDCIVVAPSLVPKRSGRRVKTDRRDAKDLAHFLRSGDLTPVFIPTSQTEAIRDLERARDDAKQDQVRARHRLAKFLLRHDRRWSGRTSWTKGHMEWIRQQSFPHEAQNLVLRDYLQVLEAATDRVDRLTKAIEESVQGWYLEPLVKNLQALRGVRLLIATIIAAEVGDLRRFSSAKQFMAFVGLVPTESSTGDALDCSRKRRGGITKTGNAHVRRMLIEAAWSFRFAPKMSPAIKRRNQGLDPEIQAIAWKAQERLHGRLRRLKGRGKQHNVALTAIARELAGFVWDIGRRTKVMQAA